jgi:cytochrome P450
MSDRSHYSDMHQLPPLGRLAGLPLLGNLLDFRHRRLALLSRAAAAGDLTQIKMGPLPVYVASSAELAHAILVENEPAFVKSRGLGVLARPLLGEGLLTSEHELHRRQRRLMGPAFAPRRLAGYARVMAECAEQSLDALADGARVDVAAEMARLTLAVVGRALFDADLHDQAREIGEALTVALHFVVDGLSRLPIPYRVPIPRHLRLRRAVRRLDETVLGIIRERRASGSDRGDVLSSLIAATDEHDGARMPDRQIRDEVMTLFLAGHETTANALTWSWYLVGRHPEAHARLAAEARALDGTPGFDDLVRLPYAVRVLKEAMRLYPPAYVMGRRTEREVVLCGRRLQAGSVVLINVYALHRRADYFPEPERFDPDRFAPAAEKAQVKGAYLPFGAGPRVCVGSHFALMEGQLLLAALARGLRFELDGPVEPEPLVTLRARGGLPATVRRR